MVRSGRRQLDFARVTEMKSFVLISLAALVSAASAEWPHLKTTWGFIPGVGSFFSEPRTQQLSSCAEDNVNFPGDRWVRDVDDLDKVIIMDGNGFIAGIQSPVPVEATLDDQYFDYSSSVYYTKGDWFGREVYYSTAYFVDPGIICNGGRSQEEFDQQGTGYMLAFQNGETPADSLEAPLTMDDAITDDLWFQHKCFLNMGVHFLTSYYDPDQPCDESLLPFQLVYDGGLLNGFVFQHIGVVPLESDRFEDVSADAIGGIVDNPPTCVLEMAEDPGISSMHVYVDNYLITC